MVGRRKQEKEETRTAARTFIYIHSCPTLKSQMNRREEEEEEERERIARWSTHCVRFVLLV